MYIKSIILDGFKSYGKRTEINGFDPEFTAITGLNGTGKSNVLDAICFVLGISNLGQVRFIAVILLITSIEMCIICIVQWIRFGPLLYKSLFTKVVTLASPKQPLQYFLITQMLLNVQLDMKSARKFLSPDKLLLAAKINISSMEKLYSTKELPIFFARFS